MLFETLINITKLNITGLTNVTGVYNIQKILGGIYDIKISLDEYQTLIIPNVEIKLGKAVELNIQLVIDYKKKDLHFNPTCG